MATDPIKVQGHNLQIDPDGVVRESCTVMQNPDGTTRCQDATCKATRTTKAEAYINENGLIINDDGTIMMGDDIAALVDKVEDTTYKLNELNYKVTQTELNLDRYKKQLGAARKRAAAEREAQIAYETAQKDKALVRVRQQLATLSPDRVAQLVVEGGLDRLGPVGQSARQVLSEAYATLQASYWIKQNETQVGAGMDNPWQAPEGLEKFIPVKTPTGRYQAVTGVCSVGALALAKAVLNDIPIESFAAMAAGDRGMTIATEALAWAIRESKPNDYPYSNGGDARGTVINWNDNAGTERDEVLGVWAKALQCPFLDLGDEDKLYYLTIPGWASYKGALFADKAEAQLVIDQLHNGTGEIAGYIAVDDSLTHPVAQRLASGSDRAPTAHRSKYDVRELILPTPTLTTV